MSTERVTLLRHLLDQSEEENKLFEQYRALVLRRWVDPQGLPEWAKDPPAPPKKTRFHGDN